MNPSADAMQWGSREQRKKVRMMSPRGSSQEITCKQLR
jgi:hypothetical protein